MQTLTEDVQIDAVVISYRLEMHLARDPDQVWRAFVDMAAALAGAGKRLIIVRQAPELPAPMRDLAMQTGGATIAGMPLAQWDRRRRHAAARMLDLPRRSIIVDPAEAFCTETACFAGQSGVSHYFDADHMSIQGAAKVARLVIDRALPEPWGGDEISAAALGTAEALDTCSQTPYPTCFAAGTAPRFRRARIQREDGFSTAR